MANGSLVSPLGQWALAHGGTTRRTGYVLILAASLAFSTAGLFTRVVTLDVWTVLFWRGLFGGLFIAAYIAWRDRTPGLPG